MEILPDLGPIYTETNLDRFPVEPLNTISNLLFLAVAIFWWRKKNSLKSQNLKNYLYVALPLLLTGYIGGTIYHATRSHVGWMLMDVVPIYFIAIATSLYHWRLINFSFLQIVGIFVGMMAIPLTILWTLIPPSPNTATFGYIIITIPVVLPIVWDQVKMKWCYLKEFLVPLSLISTALMFRALDSTTLVQEHFAIGTHWLWHTFGGCTCHFLLLYMKKRSENH